MKRSLLFIVTTVILLFSLPKVNLGQAPNLGTSADFALFTTVGAVTNAGTEYLTQVTGNVGSNSGPISGFGNVDGQLHPGDAQSAQATVDLLLAYGELAAAIPNFFPAPLLGNGAILPPGVYAIAQPTTLNLDLTLDAQGDPTAVFIFQIQGSFGANANSKVHLINGAQACNVFWKVEGLVSLAANTTMRGTIVANNAAINMVAGDTLEGRALAINGAIGVSQSMIYLPSGCGAPILTGPAAPDLASVACYTIFSSDGPVTNAGITYVTGDVGSNNGLTIGFNPLFVTGAIHAIPDGSTAQAASDLLNIYSTLNTMPYDIELMRPDLFGHNLVLTPHTYIMNAAASLTDTLYLNAMGFSDAVFVIKIYGALSTNNYSKVILINGTQSKNVFWLVSGSVSITDFSEFVGTIIVSNGAIDLTTGVNLDGRVLTTVGAVNTSAITAIMPPGCLVASPPVITAEPTDQIVCEGDSVSFTVAATGDDLTYQWRKGNTDIVGATNDTLTIDPVSFLDAAVDYNVVVSGSTPPPDTSINVSLTVDTITNITTQPVDQITCAGDSVSFTVAATGTGLTYQWRKGNIDILGATDDTLTLNPVALTDAAIDYHVVVMGACSNDTSIQVSLTVNEVTLITTQPVDQIVCVGDSVSFTVAATGTGLTYQWRKGIVDLPG
ncbi:MAG: ice-binding family protein, partial [Bacteroidales bacterium]